MNFMEYEKMKVSKMSAQDVSWKLFCLTGNINYYLLFSALKYPKKELIWENTELREL